MGPTTAPACQPRVDLSLTQHHAKGGLVCLPAKDACMHASQELELALAVRNNIILIILQSIYTGVCVCVCVCVCVYI